MSDFVACSIIELLSAVQQYAFVSQRHHSASVITLQVELPPVHCVIGSQSLYEPSRTSLLPQDLSGAAH